MVVIQVNKHNVIVKIAPELTIFLSDVRRSLINQYGYRWWIMILLLILLVRIKPLLLFLYHPHRLFRFLKFILTIYFAFNLLLLVRKQLIHPLSFTRPWVTSSGASSHTTIFKHKFDSLKFSDKYSPVYIADGSYSMVGDGIVHASAH